MTETQQRRAWLLVAAIAIVTVLLLLLVPQAHSASSVQWLAVLPVFFIGLLFSLDTPSKIGDLSTSYPPEAPSLRSYFERPPPNLLD
jgi:hypothetical protein